MSNKPEIFFMAKIEKRNVLNEIRSNNMTLQELRFFSIYLSKINARDVSTRKVRFPLSDFKKIMELGRMNIQHIKQTTDGLLMKIVHIPNERGGYSSFQLFKECTIDKNEYEEWYVEIDAHDKALPLMFDFKGRYFTYELWNALRLKSANQVRMYEILKQYEKVGQREIKVAELRELLGISNDEYPRWDNFKRKVLDSCQKALAEFTDIYFTYEKGKTGNGGKWLSIIFHIRKNENYIDKLTLDEFIIQQTTEVTTNSENEALNEKLALLSEAVENEFTMTQMNEIFQTICLLNLSDSEDLGIDIARYHYLAKKYAKLNSADERNKQNGKPIKNRFSYFLKLLQNDTDSKNTDNQAAEIDKLEPFAVTFSKNTKSQ